MTGWSPPSLSSEVIAAVVAVYVAVLLYSLLVQGSILFGLLPGLVLGALYVVWRFLVAIEAVADGVHRIADERERD